MKLCSPYTPQQDQILSQREAYESQPRGVWVARHVWHFQSPITQTLGTDTIVNVVLAITPQEGDQKALDRILTFLTERK